MKFGKVITAAAASGVLLSGAFMISRRVHRSFSIRGNVFLINTKVDVKAKKGTVKRNPCSKQYQL